MYNLNDIIIILLRLKTAFFNVSVNCAFIMHRATKITIKREAIIVPSDRIHTPAPPCQCPSLEHTRCLYGCGH